MNKEVFTLESHTQYIPHRPKSQRSELSQESENIAVHDNEKEHVLLGLGFERNFVFGWRMIAQNDENGNPIRNIKQSGYKIELFEEGPSGPRLMWDSGKVQSNKTHGIPLPKEIFKKLQSKKGYFWKVEVWDQDNNVSESKPARLEMGLKQKDWQAHWIASPEAKDKENPGRTTQFRKTFTIDKDEVETARAYVTVKGIYRLWVNGELVNDHLFAPGYTSYHHRHQYQTLDIGPLLQVGENTIALEVADGWYIGHIGAAGVRETYGKRHEVLAQIALTDKRGKERLIVSDNTWKVSQNGPTLLGDFRKGEKYDARLEQEGWNNVGFPDQEWAQAKKVGKDYRKLVSSAETPPVRAQETLKPVRQFVTPNGKTVYDFGQNIAGTVSFELEAQEGQTVTLRCGEALGKDGNLTIANFQSPADFGIPEASQQIGYTAKKGHQIYTANYPYMGFRFIEVDTEADILDISAKAVYTDMEQIGTFKCSDEDLNALFEAILWTLKSNFADNPTDCPTREMAMYTGDFQVFFRALALLMDARNPAAKVIRAMMDEQAWDGGIYNTAPNANLYIWWKLSAILKIITPLLEKSPGWADAIVLIPKAMYDVYGDKEILEETYESMKRWVNFMNWNAGFPRVAEVFNLEALWNKRYDEVFPYKEFFKKIQNGTWSGELRGWSWGYWLPPGVDAKEGMMSNLVRPNPDVSTANFAHSAGILAEIAQILGKENDYKRYSKMAEKATKAYQAHFVDPETGHTTMDNQSSYVMALQFGLIPEDLIPKAVARLVELIEENDCHLDTGFLSTGFILQVLTKYGYTDLAYKLLQQDSYPSWLYMLRQGATTITEQWDGLRPGEDPKGSLNHYAPGAAPITFFMQNVLGIQEGEGGSNHLTIKPEIGGGLTDAEGTLNSTIHGLIVVKWKILAKELLGPDVIDFDYRKDPEAGPESDQVFVLEVDIPANSTATIVMPEQAGGKTKEIGSGRYTAVGYWNEKEPSTLR